MSRNTIRKWIRSTEEVALPIYHRKPMLGKLTAFHEALEQALKADSLRHKRNRRTAKDLYAQIRLDGYQGGYTRVTDFVREWREREGKQPCAFAPLKFELGEAFQFEVGTRSWHKYWLSYLMRGWTQCR